MSVVASHRRASRVSRIPNAAVHYPVPLVKTLGVGNVKANNRRELEITYQHKQAFIVADWIEAPWMTRVTVSADIRSQRDFDLFCEEVAREALNENTYIGRRLGVQGIIPID